MSAHEAPAWQQVPRGSACCECAFFAGCSATAYVPATSKECFWSPPRFSARMVQASILDLIERQAEQGATP